MYLLSKKNEVKAIVRKCNLFIKYTDITGLFLISTDGIPIINEEEKKPISQHYQLF